MKNQKSAYAALVAVVILSALSFFWDAPVELLAKLIGEHRALGALCYTLTMLVATVVAPVTVLPLVPLVSPILGPFLTGTLSIIGWGTGAVIAFLIARSGGRPLLRRLVSLERIERYESYIPEKMQFLLIVMLRMCIPVDILSYALGLLSRVSLRTYTLATFIGIAWFAYAFAYLGSAAFEKNAPLFVAIGGASFIVFGLSWFYVIQQVRKGREE